MKLLLILLFLLSTPVYADFFPDDVPEGQTKNYEKHKKQVHERIRKSTRVIEQCKADVLSHEEDIRYFSTKLTNATNAERKAILEYKLSYIKRELEKIKKYCGDNIE